MGIASNSGSGSRAEQILTNKPQKLKRRRDVFSIHRGKAALSALDVLHKPNHDTRSRRQKTASRQST
ncbi:hypothetical protein EVAR_8784_1 [Eumeta japonica]|uniref:Uncharacterized protein n=1 Tax=Eumeta variegata TaxID=151549 RepID=A0A4C1TUG1_EUMVA|nr:hypothetical protein EVAR_8784_1 [Eumeta japonica]